MSAKNAEFDCAVQDRTLLKLAVHLLLLVLPIILTATLSPLVAVGLVGVLAFGIGMAAIHGRLDIATEIRRVLFTALIGLGFCLGGALPGAWGLFAGLGSFVFGVVALISWSEYLGIGVFNRASSAWTLESVATLRITRHFNGRMIGTVQPNSCDYLSTNGMAQMALSAVDASSQYSTYNSWVSATPNERLEEKQADGLMDVGERLSDGTLLFSAPKGEHQLRGEPHLSPGLDDEGQAGYSLWLDDQPSGLLLEKDTAVTWREDGKALVCRARPESQHCNDGEEDCWLWQQGAGWRLLGSPWEQLAGEPEITWGAPLRLEASQVWRDGSLNLVTTDCLGFGYQLQGISGNCEMLVGNDEFGRALTAECCPPPVRLCTALDGHGRKSTALYLDAMLGGLEPCLTWLRTSPDGRQSAFACRIGTWCLEGEWCLDHRVSDCGRYLALVAFAEAPAVPHRLVVADILAQRLLMLEDALLIARLETFQEGVISFIHVRGRLPDADESTPLRRFEQAAPDPQQAERFVAATTAGRLYYERAQVAVDPLSLRLLPTWRLALRPPVANVQGDFVLPAPGGRDAVWMFGSESSGVDNRLNRNEPYRGGYLVTASGCAVSDLAPSMIWSVDGRYLALFRLNRCDEPKQGGIEAARWRLLLLDTHDRTLYTARQAIGLRPCFESFDSQGLLVRISAQAQEVERGPGEELHLPLASLLQFPRQMLIRCGTLWLSTDDLPRARQWESIDTHHLHSWRTT